MEQQPYPQNPDSLVPAWMKAGRCRNEEPNKFFPDNGAGVVAAQIICRECGVRVECLEYALDNRIEDGVWGGASERERRRILRAHRTDSVVID